MNVLIDFEESQTVTKAMRKRGHNAYSCDLQPCGGGHPEWHLQMDGFEALFYMKWDLVIMHPPCPKLCLSGNRWYAGTDERRMAANWTAEVWKAAKTQCSRVALENPVGVLNSIFSYLPKPQYIQPWMFGHGEVKKTGLMLHGLPNLIPTDIVDGREERIFRMGPSKDRSKIRSKTYEGIADAMATQWT